MKFFLRFLGFASATAFLACLGVFTFSRNVYAADTIVSQQYQDSNQNGTIDHVQLVFNANLTQCTYDAADWSINTAGTINITAITGIEGSCSGASPVLSLTVTVGTTLVTGGSTAPVISYTNAGTANSLQDSGVITNKASLTLADGAKPIIKTVALADSNANGLVDQIVMTWTENVDTNDGAAPVSSDIPATVLPDGSSAVFDAATISDPAGASPTLTISGVTGQVTANTAVGSTAISGDMSGKWVDGAGNTPHAAAATGQATVSETMSPLITSSTPSNSATGVQRGSTMTLVFSESITSLSYTLSPSMTLTNATSLPASTITLTGTKLSGTNTFTVTAAPDSSANAFGSFTSTGTTSISFLVASADTSATPVDTSETYDVALSSPEESDTYTAGSVVFIEWSTAGGSGSPSAMNIDYSLDGATWTSIVEGTANDGSYSWTAPDITSSSVRVRVEGTDLVDVLASDTSEEFSLVGSGDTEEDADTEEGVVEEDAADTEHDGHYIRGTSWSTVYYIDGTTRHPFLDTQTFFTYADDFSDVVTVDDDVLSDYTMGSPMLPNPGTILIKVQSVAKVYFMDTDGDLRWIADEDVASTLFGSSWADYVIDVPVTAWGHFTFGDDVETEDDVEVNADDLKTREEVND